MKKEALLRLQYAQAAGANATRSPASGRGTVRATLALAVLLGGGCVSESRPGLPPASPFSASSEDQPTLVLYGVAAGDVTDRTAVIWFRTEGPARAQVEWTAEGRPEAGGRSDILTTAESADFAFSLPVTGLRPDTVYRYRVLAGPVVAAASSETLREAAAGRFRTAPAPEAGQPQILLWGADLGGQKRCRIERQGYPIFDVMLKQEPSLVLLLGDLIYADDRCPSPPNVPGADYIAVTLDDFRGKHRYQRGDLFLQRLLAAVPVAVTWDDHEVRNNFSGPFEPLMTAGRQALFEYWPIPARNEAPGRIYRSLRRGADVEIFILDTRQYRSRNADPDGPAKTMLGLKQRDWLVESLENSTARWKVIVTSMPLGNAKPGGGAVPGNDSWARGADGTGFQTELDWIVGEIRKRQVKNVVWLAADVHYAQANAYDPDRDGRPDFYEFIAGPLSARFGLPVPPAPALNPTMLYSEGDFVNFGRLTVDGKRLQVDILDEAGRAHFTRTLQAE